ncbi:MAG: peptidylprolyl isomerase [Xanthomonadales bacterium]|nr:peptidylprolyl isomerase [Xanthomonadales bacterium]
MNALLLLGLGALHLSASDDTATRTWPNTLAEVLAATEARDWRTPAADQTLVMTMRDGARIVIELAPSFAPRHVDNIRKLAQAHFFDGLPIVRSQDNYVVQWGDPDGQAPRGEAAGPLAAEFSRSTRHAPVFTTLIDGDVYAPEVGFVEGFPAARDPATERLWLTHCYGMLGVGRDESIDSGDGSELYVVNGHSPRHLDRNVTLVGRVLQGMPALASLPRGSGALGFYEEGQSRPQIASIRLASELPEDQRPRLQLLRTDGEAFAAVIKARRTRRESWFHTGTGAVELCNVPLPIREMPAADDD